MKMTYMPTIHAYQRYRNTRVYAYMVTFNHPEIPPSSKIDDWVNNSINTIYVTPRFHGYGGVTATYIRRSENALTYIR